MGKNGFKGFVALLLAGVIFGSFSIWVKLLGQDFTNFQQIAFRNILAIFVAVAIIVYKKTKVDFSGADKKRVIQFGISFPLSVIFFTYSLVSTKVILGIFSFYVGSIASSYFIGRKFFNEKLTINKAISLILVGLGLTSFIALSPIKKLEIGVVYGLLGGFFDAVSNGYRKYLSGKVDRILLSSVPLVGGAIIAVIMMVFSSESFSFQISNLSWAVGIVFGISLFVVNYLMFYGFSNFDLNLGTIVVSSELVFASVFALIVFSEAPLPNEVMGALLIIGSIIVANTKPRLLKK